MSNKIDERIAAAKVKKEQYEKQIQALMQQQKEQARKARTKRLIERGAMLESLLDGAPEASNERIKAFLEKTIRTEDAKKIWERLSAADSTATVQTMGGGAGQAGF